MAVDESVSVSLILMLFSFSVGSGYAINDCKYPLVTFRI